MLGLLGLKSGSLYPILMRLADRGLLAGLVLALLTAADIAFRRQDIA